MPPYRSVREFSMNGLSTKEVATRVGVSTATLRLWTTQDYKAFFTPDAQGDGKRRTWRDHDVKLAKLIAEMRSQNMDADDIIATLQTMRANDWKGLPEMPDALPSLAAVQKVAETRLDEREKALRSHIATLAGEIETLRTELRTERQRSTELGEQLSAKERALGLAQGELEAMKAADRRERRLWLAVVIVAAIAAGGVAAVVVLAVR